MSGWVTNDRFQDGLGCANRIELWANRILYGLTDSNYIDLIWIAGTVRYGMVNSYSSFLVNFGKDKLKYRSGTE